MRERYEGAGIFLCRKNSDGEYEILLGQRKINPDEGKWSILGGEKGKGETPEENAKREFFEEGSVDIDSLDAKKLDFVYEPTFEAFSKTKYFEYLKNDSKYAPYINAGLYLTQGLNGLKQKLFECGFKWKTFFYEIPTDCNPNFIPQRSEISSIKFVNLSEIDNYDLAAFVKEEIELFRSKHLNA